MDARGNKPGMTDEEFFDAAAIAALQGMLSAGNWSPNSWTANNACKVAAAMVMERRALWVNATS